MSKISPPSLECLMHIESVEKRGASISSISITYVRF